MSDELQMEPQDALRQMLESDGFALFHSHARTEWGPAAVNRKIKAALLEHPVADHSALVQSIIKTAEDIAVLFKWPEEEHARLRAAAAQPPEQADRFAKHRLVQT